MCDKVPYANEKTARDAARGISKNGKQSMRHYYCRLCEAWHIETEGKRSVLGKIGNHNKYPFRYRSVKKDITVKKKKK